MVVDTIVARDEFVPSWVSIPFVVRPYTAKNSVALFISPLVAAAAKMFTSHIPLGIKEPTFNWNNVLAYAEIRTGVDKVRDDEIICCAAVVDTIDN